MTQKTIYRALEYYVQYKTVVAMDMNHYMVINVTLFGDEIDFAFKPDKNYSSVLFGGLVIGGYDHA